MTQKEKIKFLKDALDWLGEVAQAAIKTVPNGEEVSPRCVVNFNLISDMAKGFNEKIN